MAAGKFARSPLGCERSCLRFYRQNCIQYASDMQGANFSVQSNMMLTNEVCNAMAAAFRALRKPLAERVLAALDGAQSVAAIFAVCRPLL